MSKKVGVLLVNLGTPKTTKTSDILSYLFQFLTDGRVIDMPWLWRQLLVRCAIVPKRYRFSQASYKQIWTEDGSPLMIHSKKLQADLTRECKKNGLDYQVGLGMRYQKPSIAEALYKLKGVNKIIVLPLFPQYASATTGSIHQEVMKIISRWQLIPEMHFIRSYPKHKKMIAAFADIAKKYHPEQYDHVMLSFHGLPENQLKKADSSGYCLSCKNCCQNHTDLNRNCYGAECYQTAYAIAEALNLKKENYTVCFQSRLGNSPWIKPYTSDVLDKLVKDGAKKVLVLSPAFVADCLETLFEIQIEYREEFLKQGGEELTLVPALNSHPFWVEALHDIIQQEKQKS